MRPKEVILKELDAVVAAGMDVTSDRDELFWKGRALCEELLRDYKERQLINFCRSVLGWPDKAPNPYAVVTERGAKKKKRDV